MHWWPERVDTPRQARFSPSVVSHARRGLASSPTAVVACTVLGALVAGCASGSGRSATKEPAPKPTVTAKDIEAQPGEPIERVLQSKSPGVMITRTPDGGIAVQIRGASSFSGNTQPLYVIDGVPIEAGPGGALTGINPYDIETIQVLKDPAELALYGVRGANGVVIIKTKRAGKS